MPDTRGHMLYVLYGSIYMNCSGKSAEMESRVMADRGWRSKERGTGSACRMAQGFFLSGDDAVELGSGDACKPCDCT